MRVPRIAITASFFLGLMLGQSISSQEPKIPILVSASVRTYPAIWRAAHLQGSVVALVTIRDGAVEGIEIKSGENHLQVPTVANLKTWQFEKGVNASLTVTYTYEISGEPTEDRTNPTVVILPSLDVRITACPVKPTINYSK
jgi:hypothetical protein